jgi:hypothetical protein
MKRKICISFIIVTILVATVFAVISSNFLLITSLASSEPIGIIDTQLFNEYDINYLNTSDAKAFGITHGDRLLNFLKDCKFEGNLYYYAAVNSNGFIKTERIIEGLEWLYANNVKKVNMSLSTKRYEKTLQEWISNHKDVNIYASYNNLLNSLDYPAMYNDVIASGSDERIKYKSIDRRYSTSKIVMLNGLTTINFDGNSFLSLVTAIKDN